MPTLRSMALVPSETKISKMRLGDLICENKFNIHPDKLINMDPKMEVLKMIFLFNWVIFRFHGDFPGCSYCRQFHHFTPN